MCIVKVKVTLRLTVSQSVSLGIEHSPGTYDQIFITPRQLWSRFVGRPLWREDRSVFCICCWPLPAQRFSLWTCDHILLSHIWNFPFCRLLRLAGSRWSYSTLCISAGLGSLLYSFGADPTENIFSIVIPQLYFDCYLHIRSRGNLFIDSLPSNERLILLRYSGFQASCHSIRTFRFAVGQYHSSHWAG
jgi:hypothetical protein